MAYNDSDKIDRAKVLIEQEIDTETRIIEHLDTKANLKVGVSLPDYELGRKDGLLKAMRILNKMGIISDDIYKE